MTSPVPNPGIMKISAYVAGEGKVEGVAQVRKLSANENPLGPSPKAIEAYGKLGAELHRYPEGASSDLRGALAKHYGLDVNRIVCSAGSDELITLLCSAYIGPGDEVVFNRYGFAMYPIATLARGGVPVMADEDNYTASVDALIAKVTSKTKIVFLANPNNPTGTYLPYSEIQRLRAGLPASVLLVLDAAYSEYVTRNDYDAGAQLVEAHDNVVMLRTFSKIYALAGLRVGWGYFPPEIVAVLERIRSPFNVSLAAQHVAVAALNDVAWVDKSRAHNDAWLPRVKAAVEELGLTTVPSVGNFLLIRFPAAPKDAKAAEQFMKGKGMILRPVGGYGLPEFLRLTIGTEDDNLAFIAALKEFMGK